MPLCSRTTAAGSLTSTSHTCPLVPPLSAFRDRLTQLRDPHELTSSAQPPLKTLYDVNQHAPHVLRQSGFSVFLDGGVRHGTDVLKAMCLGADAVGLGRPFIYAAAAWGPEGVEKACMLLEEEIEIGMKLLGVTRLDQLGPEYLDTSKL